MKNGYTMLSYMAIYGNNSFAWPTKEDLFKTLNDDILLPVKDIVPLNNRGLFDFFFGH